jgi:hypothetical protein
LLIRRKKIIILGFKGLKNRSPGVSISGFTVCCKFYVFSTFMEFEQRVKNVLQRVEDFLAILLAPRYHMVPPVVLEVHQAQFFDDCLFVL